MQVNLDNSFRVRELQVLFKPTRFKSPATIGSPFEIVSQGTANTSLAYASEVFKAVLLTNSTAFILAHNHPSGNCEPSLEDRQIAERISKAAELIGIKLLDFLIVTEDSFYSFAQSEPSILNKGGES